MDCRRRICLSEATPPLTTYKLTSDPGAGSSCELELAGAI